MNSSVKFLSPRTIGGLPLPGWEDPLDPELALELEPELALEPPDALVEDDELPQAASTTTARRAITAASAGLATDRIQILQQRFLFGTAMEAECASTPPA